jgi:hypothetical protein
MFRACVIFSFFGGMIMKHESKSERVNRLARVLRESFAHIAPRQAATVSNEIWAGLVYSVYQTGLNDEQILEIALDAVFGNKGK